MGLSLCRGVGLRCRVVGLRCRLVGLRCRLVGWGVGELITGLSLCRGVNSGIYAELEGLRISGF